MKVVEASGLGQLLRAMKSAVAVATVLQRVATT